ncbi:MAG: DNA polymerase III subunit delta [Pseudomonadota bacterium]
MVALSKAQDINSFLANPKFDRKVILLFGPDQGLVSERAAVLATKSGVDLADPFCVIRLDADEAAADSARISDEAHTVAMFGGKRLIWISGTTRRDLGKAIKPVLATPPDDAIILIEAGDLKKNSGLRGLLERSKEALCIPCYQDADAALDQLINEELVAHGIKVDAAVRTELKSLLGDNRMVSRGELAKLALYTHSKDTVTIADVRDIVGDAARMVIDEIVDATATGDTGRLQEKLPRAMEADHSPDMLMLAMLRHFQMLQAMRSRMDTQRQPATAVIGSARPPIHFTRRDTITRALSIWPVDRISRALARLDKAMLDCRRTAGLGASLAGTTLLAMALEAKALARRR